MIIKEKERETTEGLGSEPYGGCTSRVREARQRCINTTPTICLERAKFMTEVFMKTEGEPLVMRKAKAFKELCERGTIFIQDDELIIGHQGSKILCGSLSPDTDYSILSGEKANSISTRPGDPFVMTEEQKSLFNDFIEPYWKGKSFRYMWDAWLSEEMHQLNEARAFHSISKGRGGAGSYAGNYELVINIGINGIRKRINEKLASFDATIPGDNEKIIYLEALLIVCDGIETYANRYTRLAREKADEEKNPQRKAELKKIAEICEHVPINPARTFWEAVQSLFFYHALQYMEHNSTNYNLGRLDQYLYPYYKKDIEEGKLTKEQAQELLECLWVKLQELLYLTEIERATLAPNVATQNVVCGGITKSGQDAVNELSYMIIQATMDVRLPNPRLCIRYNKAKNPDSFLRKAAELAALGTGHPAFQSDEVGINYLLARGISSGDVWNWSSRGCYEPTLTGKLGKVQASLADVSLACPVELALLNGVHRKSKSRLPVPQTGDPRNFKTFEEFKEAVKTQLAYLIKKAVEQIQLLDLLQEQRPVLVTSLSFEECIENAKDIMSGGAKYSSGSAELGMIGMADIVNSLMAVKKLIYKDKKLTWDELLEALDNDFEGYEEIYKMCLSAPKFGNDIPEVDEIATEISQFAAEEAGKYKGLYGTNGVPCKSASSGGHLIPGPFVGALPSGRKAWQPLADGISPMQGTDVTGITANIKSVSKCRHDLLTAGTLLNLKLSPSIFQDERGIGDFTSLIKSCFDLGLFCVQFNVVSPEVLREAQRCPEKYRNLVVRVSGYSAFFTQIPKRIQDDIISRSTISTLVS